MAVLTDPNGTVWAVDRRMWPFPGDALDAFDWFAVILAALFAVLWPFWILAKFCGVRWVITVDRDGHEVGRELVRGWSGSKRRINEIALEIAAGGRSGHMVI